MGPAEIVFGPGVYDFTRLPAVPGGMQAAIGLDGLTNVMLRGGGPGVTVLRLMPEQDLRAPGTQNVLDTDVVRARNCRGLTLRDLTVHGAYLTMRKAVERDPRRQRRQPGLPKTWWSNGSRSCSRPVIVSGCSGNPITRSAGCG